MIELYLEVVVKLFDIGITNADQFDFYTSMREKIKIREFHLLTRKVTQGVMDRYKINHWAVVAELHFMIRLYCSLL
jgi:hypothetical protein